MAMLPKRERTRRQLISAGFKVLAERGEAFTASDVVSAAEVSNGTFYNHFVDRDDFILALAHESLQSIADTSASETEGADPAWRFAAASTRVLATAVRDRSWGRAVLRLSECPTPTHAGLQRHLCTDLRDGLASGRFRHGDDPVTVDLVTGTIMSTIRRLTADPEAEFDPIRFVVQRLLEILGIESAEAADLASSALAAEPQHCSAGV